MTDKLEKLRFAPDETEMELIMQFLTVSENATFKARMNALVYSMVILCVRSDAGSIPGAREMLTGTFTAMVNGCWEAAKGADQIVREFEALQDDRRH